MVRPPPTFQRILQVARWLKQVAHLSAGSKSSDRLLFKKKQKILFPLEKPISSTLEFQQLI